VNWVDVSAVQKTFRRWTRYEIYVNGKLSKIRAKRLQRRCEEFSGKLVKFFYLRTEMQQTCLTPFPCCTADDSRHHNLEPGHVKNEWGWKSPLDMTAYTGLKRDWQVLQCWKLVHKRDGIKVLCTDKPYGVGISQNHSTTWMMTSILDRNKSPYLLHQLLKGKLV
jgi:hypothetical protein